MKRAMYTLNIESTVKGALKNVWIVFNLFQHVFTVLQFIPKYGSSLQCTRVLVFVLILYVPVNNFSVMSGWTFMGWTSTKQRMDCIAQGHSAAVVWWAVISYSCPSWKDAAMQMNKNEELLTSNCLFGGYDKTKKKYFKFKQHFLAFIHKL